MEFGFYLKKFITFFIEPFGLVLSLLIFSLYLLVKNKNSYAKIFLSLTFGLMLLLAYPPFSNFLVSNLENQYPKYSYKHNIKYIHVLGNGHNTDSSQPISSQIGDGGIKRVLEGVIIHLKTPDSKLIFTGYEGNTDISNAVMNMKLAISLGVKKEDIIVNPLPKDTKEEALFTKKILGDEKFVLVTSATHMPRSMKLFKELGLNPVPAPTNFYKEEFDGFFRVPRIGYFYASKIAIHEYFGILWSMVKD
ncbi:MAG: ElyC/SanA/YdcF family protein [Campylobacterota bacterium]|nr:ElyC/SanA/YdcF family protein [Campylobacterota bacterium]